MKCSGIHSMGTRGKVEHATGEGCAHVGWQRGGDLGDGNVRQGLRIEQDQLHQLDTKLSEAARLSVTHSV